MKKTFLLAVLLLFVTNSFAILRLGKNAYVPDDDEPFHEKMALHPKHRLWFNFPDTTITFKENNFKCEAKAWFLNDDFSQFTINVQGKFTDSPQMDVPGIVVHYEGDDIVLPKKEGVQKAKAKYLVWCFPPITGYNTDMYLHVKVEFNYQNVDECRIRYKMKAKKTKHPFFPISKEIYKTKDWEKCKEKKDNE